MEFARRTVARFALVTLASFCTDVLWTLTVLATSAHHVVPATALSVAMVYAAAYVTVSYVKDRRLVHAAALGSAVGTVVALLVTR